MTAPAGHTPGPWLVIFDDGTDLYVAGYDETAGAGGLISRIKEAPRVGAN